MTGIQRTLSPEAAALLTLDTHPWLSCDDCFEWVDRVVDGFVTDRFVSGSFAIPAEFRAHLAGCPACLEETGALVALVAEDDGLDPELALAEFGYALLGRTRRLT
jgi:hypothetical protein